MNNGATWNDDGSLATRSGGTGFPLYASGDLLYGTGEIGVTGLARLGIGAANTLLVSDGGAPTWAGAWASYTPTYAAGSGGAAIGNGTRTGRWARFGKFVTAHMCVIMGSTTTYGTGALIISLPSTSVTTVQLYSWAASIYDSSAGRIYPVISQLFSTTQVSCYEATGLIVSALVPFTFATGDQISVTAVYEEA